MFSWRLLHDSIIKIIDGLTPDIKKKLCSCAEILTRLGIDKVIAE